MNKRLTAIALLLILCTTVVYPCTVAVISGKATPDGRPLLWKNRDSGFAENSVKFFKGKKYSYIGIINATTGGSDGVWSGQNSAGFCIMNSASFNLNLSEKQREKDEDGYTVLKDEEGTFMAMALGTCATVADFEELLKSTNGKRGIEANFGVIDAQGGAMFFETEIESYVKFDANDQRVAPDGYIVRTNYSFTGQAQNGYGFIRYNRAAQLFHQERGAGISLEWLLSTVSRDLVNGLTGIDNIEDHLPANSRDRRFFYAHDSIVRSTNCSTTVMQGVKEGENPENTIMWTRIGHSLTSVAVPHWVSTFEDSEICIGEPDCQMGRFAAALKRKIFPISGGSRDRYMDLAVVVNAEGTGLLAKLSRVEAEIIKYTTEQFGKSTLSELQKGAEKLCIEGLKREFGDLVE